MSYRRVMLRHDILGRCKKAAIDFASPADFTLGPPLRVGSLPPEDGAIPYCFDPVTERVWFAVCADADAVLRAPFLYAAQFTRARQIVTVPFEMLEDCMPVSGAAPTAVFSIGRCGSTLLAGLLDKLGVRAVSEPDVLSQLAQMLASPPHGMAPGYLGCLVRICYGSLRVHCGDGFLVKLRSQCNHVAADIMRAWPAARCVFMLRGDRHAWARSRYRAFGETAHELARLLAWGISTYHALSQTGCDLKLLWYEDLRDSPAWALRAAGFAVELGQISVLRDRLDEDSQSGTALARGLAGFGTMPESELAAFDCAWAAHRPAALIEQHGLQRLG